MFSSTKKMKFLQFRIWLALIVLSLASANSFAGQNPIGFALTPTTGIPASTQTGNSYTVLYTLTNNLPFAKKISAVTDTIKSIGFSVTDNCSGQTLAAYNGSCFVHIIFQPAQIGAASLQLQIHYDKNVVPLPTLSTTVTSSATTDISGVTSTTLPADTTVGTGYPVVFTFSNIGSTDVTASSVTLTGDTGDFVISSNNCTSVINANKTCAISGIFTPSTAGSKSIGETYAYSSGTKSVALSAHTIASSSVGGCASVSGSTALLLPAQTYQYADNVVKFIFTNQCDAASATLGNVNVSATLNGSSVNNWVTSSSGTAEDTCSGQTLAADASCSFLASVIPAATGNNLSVVATVNYTESSQSKTASAATQSTSVQSNDSTNRMVTIINQCSVPVWMTFVAAAVPNSPTCPSTACPTGSTCNSLNNKCYYINPSLDGNHINGKLAAAIPGAAPDTMNISISEDNSGTSPIQNILYNAGISARLGCGPATSPDTNPLFCSVNNCGGTQTPLSGATESDGQCSPGTAPSSSSGFTFNAVEFTFLRNYSSVNKTTDGVYDQQTINGVNVPMEIKGRGTPSLGIAPYSNCNSAGAPLQSITGSATTQLGNCAYNYSTPGGFAGSNYRVVTYSSGAVDCTTNDNLCSGTTSDICGLTYVPPPSNFIAKRCGALAGYVSVNTGICSHATNAFEGSLGTTLRSLYHCDTNYTYSTGAELYSCSGTYAAQSCYNPLTGNPAASCCGCIDWWTSLGGSLSVPTLTKSCGIYANPDWTTNPSGIVQPQIQWVKSACPTAYAYQYDDPSSSFLCSVINNNKIVTNYQVTFCPGGKQVSYVTP